MAAGCVPVAAASSAVVTPVPRAARTLLEEPELDAQVHEPRSMEAPEARDQVVVPVVVAHRADCRTVPVARVEADAGTVASCNGCERRAGFRGLMDTDDRLAADLARDLDGAFEALVLAHQDRLYTIALRMLGDPRDAEEAAQDALVRAYRALATYDAARIRELRLRGWLTTIVLNLCRTRGLRRAGARCAADLAGWRRSPGSRADCVARRRRRPRSPNATPNATAGLPAWRELPPVYRAAVVLRHVDGLSYPEAAAALGRPEGTRQGPGPPRDRPVTHDARGGCPS